MICFSQEAPTIQVKWIFIVHVVILFSYRRFTWCFLQDVPTLRVKSDILYVCVVICLYRWYVCLSLQDLTKLSGYYYNVHSVFVVSPFTEAIASIAVFIDDLDLTDRAYSQFLVSILTIFLVFCVSLCLQTLRGKCTSLLALMLDLTRLKLHLISYSHLVCKYSYIISCLICFILGCLTCICLSQWWWVGFHPSHFFQLIFAGR